MTTPNNERREEIERIIGTYAARTLDIVSLMIRGDISKDARHEANERALNEALDALCALPPLPPRGETPTNLQKVQSAPASQALADQSPDAGKMIPAEAQARVEALDPMAWVIERLEAASKTYLPGGPRDVKGMITNAIDAIREFVPKAPAALLSGSTPKPAGVEITEEMVERAARQISIRQTASSQPSAFHLAVARAALTAALSTAQDGEG